MQSYKHLSTIKWKLPSKKSVFKASI